MRLITLLSFLTFFCLGELSAQGFYLGAGIGNAFHGAEFSDIDDEVHNIDKNSTSYKFFGGYQTGSFFNFEGGYRNLGTIKFTETDITYESKTTGWDVYGLGRLQIFEIIDLMGKAGIIFWNTESQFNNQDRGGDGTSFAWGLGAGVHLGPLGVRLEWENFTVDNPKNLSMLSLGATYGF